MSNGGADGLAPRLCRLTRNCVLVGGFNSLVCTSTSQKIKLTRDLCEAGRREEMPSANKQFETARTREFRAGSLSKEDERTISHIEEFGCSVVSVARTKYGLGWSYTIGVFDTINKPELITVGLLPETAHHALNQATKLLRAGVDLSRGRHDGLIGEVDCEFRLVDPKWVRRLMGWAVWYYRCSDFPLLQLVYPDRENRFPEDEAFDKAFEQPLMQPAAQMRKVEDDFWASADPKAVYSIGTSLILPTRESFFLKLFIEAPS